MLSCVGLRLYMMGRMALEPVTVFQKGSTTRIPLLIRIWQRRGAAVEGYGVAAAPSVAAREVDADADAEAALLAAASALSAMCLRWSRSTVSHDHVFHTSWTSTPSLSNTRREHGPWPVRSFASSAATSDASCCC